MHLVIRTDCGKKNPLEHPAVKGVLAPFNPLFSGELLDLDTKCYYYFTLDDNAPLKKLIVQLMQVEGIEAVYEKPLEFPPM